MWVKLFATVTLILTLSAVVTNTAIIKNQISEISREVNALDVNSAGALEYAKEIRKGFSEKLTYISLTVSHDDLTNIEEGFAELIGYLEVEDYDGAHVTKSRLKDSLEHLGRLSGFNIDAII